MNRRIAWKILRDYLAADDSDQCRYRLVRVRQAMRRLDKKFVGKKLTARRPDRQPYP